MRGNGPFCLPLLPAAGYTVGDLQGGSGPRLFQVFAAPLPPKSSLSVNRLLLNDFLYLTTSHDALSAWVYLVIQYAIDLERPNV